MVKRITRRCGGELLAVMAAAGGIAAFAGQARAQAPIEVGFLWHMHQPIYYPYESVVQTQNAARFSFNLFDIHNQRYGPYSTWPKDAVQAGANAGLGHLGASVSFTGSLIQNLNALQGAGVNGGMWNCPTPDASRRVPRSRFGTRNRMPPVDCAVDRFGDIMGALGRWTTREESGGYPPRYPPRQVARAAVGQLFPPFPPGLLQLILDLDS